MPDIAKCRRVTSNDVKEAASKAEANRAATPTAFDV